ncbi:MAG: helix-turn-helix transcriptional regulator [Oceanospirillaceae bacterium]|nr:helix-turn-helix transcriptional regulator [Oceanospirillaceae bacterium]
MNSLEKRFGDKVRQLRTSVGMSQEKLANLAGIDRAHMGHIERGTVSPSLKKVSQIAKALGVSPQSLLGDA